MYPRMGILELLITCVVGTVGLGVPVATLVIVFMTYNKVKKLEESAKSKTEQE